MSGPERDDERDEQLSPLLSVAVDALRSDVPVRAEWRTALVRALDDEAPRPVLMPMDVGRRPAGRWELRPLAAIAAGLACAAAGAGLTALLLGRSASPTDDLVATPAVAARGPAPNVSDRVSTVRFVLVAPYAARVSVVGDFNRWNPAAMPMRRSTDGRTWELAVPLAPGRHVYAFSIDGDLAADPTAPLAGDDDFGTKSSVILVSGGSS